METKLTAPQARALAAVAEGLVRYTHSQGYFERLSKDAWKSRRLNDKMIETLKRLRLIELAPRDGYSFEPRAVLLTDAGRKCLDVQP
jgi:hypothetical protein